MILIVTPIATVTFMEARHRTIVLAQVLMLSYQFRHPPTIWKPRQRVLPQRQRKSVCRAKLHSANSPCFH